MVDISEIFLTDEVRPLRILGAKKEPVGLTLHMMSLDCRASREASHDAADAMFEKSDRKPESRFLEKEQLDKLCACVKGWDWHGNTWKGKKDPEFTPEALREVLEVLWIGRQAFAFAGDLANFTSAVAKG
jgi:hypothetical protein